MTLVVAALETVPCGLCERPTLMLGTRRCDRCAELETRVGMASDELLTKAVGEDRLRKLVTSLTPRPPVDTAAKRYVSVTRASVGGGASTNWMIVMRAHADGARWAIRWLREGRRG